MEEVARATGSLTDELPAVLVCGLPFGLAPASLSRRWSAALLPQPAAQLAVLSACSAGRGPYCVKACTVARAALRCAQGRPHEVCGSWNMWLHLCCFPCMRFTGNLQHLCNSRCRSRPMPQGWPAMSHGCRCRRTWSQCRALQQSPMAHPPAHAHVVRWVSCSSVSRGMAHMRPTCGRLRGCTTLLAASPQCLWRAHLPAAAFSASSASYREQDALLQELTQAL